MSGNYKILNGIDSPSDIKILSEKEVSQLSRELREFILESVSKTGGHLAASLGSVEITIALHYVYNTPKDILVWDIGHQCYPHKILTGRKHLMSTLRKKNGISGFLKRNESVYDSFGAGHSSTSISAAIGYEIAARLKKEDKKVVAIIGDGGLTAGMAFEALGHAGGIKSDILVVLNDNDMSISPNVGAINKYLTKILTSKTFSSIKESSKKVLKKVKAIEEIAKKVESQAKGLVTPGLLFEELGFKYFGPVDGHDVNNLTEVLKNLKDKKGPRLLHIITKKGKGYKLAEQNPISYHGVTPFDIKTGKTTHNKINNKLSYTQIFSEWINKTASVNENIVAITPAMREGSGLVEFEKKFPSRYFDVGIAEQHALTLAAGLSCGGLKPVVAIYSTFLQRAYDQLIHDITIQELDVLFAIDRAGIVGADGETHQGIYDISFLRILPKIVLMAPSDENQMFKMLNTGLNYKGVAAVRYPRGQTLGIDFIHSTEVLEIGKGEVVKSGKKIAYLVFGTLLHTVKSVANDFDATVVDMKFVKPIDEELIAKVCQKHQYIITVEDNVISGGAGTAVSEIMNKLNLKNHLLNLGFPDKQIPHGNQNELMSELQLDEDGIREMTNNHIHIMESVNKKAK
ncbi:MAG: 1-deoxy-D-xylulose-5-phosphate synthase [Gammaproteobacteria bacterium]|nr:1-deoxy-D-xylulose-5-phosphate synthase [Gammaproteobacteria bacterium]